MKNPKDPDMNYFFNDVRVTYEEFQRLVKDADDHFELLDAAKRKQAAAEAELEARAKAKKKAKTKKARVGFNPPTVKTETKTDIAASIIKVIGKKNKDRCIEVIQEELGVSKSNASCYYNNVLKKL